MEGLINYFHLLINAAVSCHPSKRDENVKLHGTRRLETSGVKTENFCFTITIMVLRAISTFMYHFRLAEHFMAIALQCDTSDDAGASAKSSSNDFLSSVLST